MKRNIDVLFEIQNKIRKFYFLTDEADMYMQLEELDLADVIERADETGLQMLCDILNIINDVDKLLDLLTEDLKNSSYSEEFDCDDYKIWNARLIHSPYNLEGLSETFSEALKTLDLYILETIRGYRILNQYAYEEPSSLPGENQEEANVG